MRILCLFSLAFGLFLSSAAAYGQTDGPTYVRVHSLMLRSRMTPVAQRELIGRLAEAVYSNNMQKVSVLVETENDKLKLRQTLSMAGSRLIGRGFLEALEVEATGADLEAYFKARGSGRLLIEVLGLPEESADIEMHQRLAEATVQRVEQSVQAALSSGLTVMVGLNPYLGLPSQMILGRLLSQGSTWPANVKIVVRGNREVEFSPSFWARVDSRDQWWASLQEKGSRRLRSVPSDCELHLRESPK